MKTPALTHIPVLKSQVMEALAPARGGRYLDGTLGLGGHAKAVLNASPDSLLCGLDRDEDALEIARHNLDEYKCRTEFFHLPFSKFAEALTSLKWKGVDGAMVDLGISSLQLDSPERGFSFRTDGPLDMRMNREDERSAIDIVNKWTHRELSECIATLGEDPQAGRIARKIIEARQKKKIETTSELADIIWHAYPPAWRRSAKNHPATRAFQALRMEVNNELEELKQFLDSILQWLLPGGRLAVISFHSLEDRLVKHAIRGWARKAMEDPEAPQVRILYKKPVLPTEEEIAQNPRAGSAKLRAIEKLD